MDYILLNSARTDLVKRLIYEYFDHDFKHDSVEIVMLQNADRSLVLLEFAQPIDNMLFVYLFEYFTTDPEFQKDNLIGWFSVSDKVVQNSISGEFGGSIPGDTFSRRVMLTTQMNDEYVVGYSNNGEKIEFYHSGEFSVSNENSFRESELHRNDFQQIESIHIELSNSSKSSKGCLGSILFATLIASALAWIINYNFF